MDGGIWQEIGVSVDFWYDLMKDVIGVKGVGVWVTIS